MIVRNNPYNLNYNLSFRSSLDYEKNSLKSKLASLKNEAANYRSLQASETSSFNNESGALDSRIRSARSSVNSTNARIDYVKESIAQKEREIENERIKTNNLVAQVESNNKQIQELQKKQKEVLLKNLERTQNKEVDCAKKISDESGRLSKIYNEKVNIANNGLKQQIIDALINPTIELMDGNDVVLPSLVLFENGISGDEGKLAEKKLLEWIAKSSNSNFAYINAKDYHDKDSFILLLKKLSFQSLQEYEKSGRYSYTMISNFDVMDSSKLKQENQLFFNKLFNESAKFFNNTIIAVTSNIKDNKTVGKLSLKSFKLDKNFITDKLFGIQSLINKISTARFEGQDLLKIIR